MNSCYKLEEAKELMGAVSLGEGEVRSYSECGYCGGILIREYIPYATGYGRAYLGCAGYHTGNNNNKWEVLEQVEGPIYSLNECEESS